MLNRFSSNKHGQVLVLTIMLCVLAFICALIFINPIKSMVDISRNSANLDCTNNSISVGQSSTCLIVDLYLPAFIGAVVFTGIAYIGAKLASGGF